MKKLTTPVCAAAPTTAAVEPFARTPGGKPLIPLAAEELYAFGDLVRRTEQAILDLFSQGLVSGTTHTCLGQELCQMAVVRALEHPRDVVLSNHRNHGHFLTYSGDFTGLIAEVLGREAGVCRGAGGSQHIAYRHFHSNGVQGGMTAIGIGEALARKWEGDGSIVAVIIGDGTLGEGLVYESLNCGAIWNVPVLFVVERNHIAQTTPTAATIGGSVEARGTAFGYETWTVSDTNDEFFQEVQQAVEWVRQHRRPGFLVIDTRRLGPHSKGDDSRDAEEIAAIRRRDPLAAMGARLKTGAREQIETANVAYLREALAKALESPVSRYSSAPQHVFDVSRVSSTVTKPNAGNHATVRASLNAALHQMLADDQRVVLLGEDLHDPYGGAFKVTAGLSSAFPGRVLSTPISEAAVVGAGIGLALAGYRPIVEIMFADFLTLAADQLYNHAVKFSALFPGTSVPLVIRTPSGGRRGYGPTHSQSPENILLGLPGLTVLFPSHRHDSGTLLHAATMAWNYPVVFLEHKLLYGVPQSAGDYTTIAPSPLDPGSLLFPTLRTGSTDADVTLVTYGGMLPLVEEVAEHLRQHEELSVEIVAPALLAPFPRRTLLPLLASRRRIVVVEETHVQNGLGGELGSSLLEAGFRGSFTRVGTPPVPIPSARSLESDVLPGKQHIIDRVVAAF